MSVPPTLTYKIGDCILHMRKKSFWFSSFCLSAFPSFTYFSMIGWLLRTYLQYCAYCCCCCHFLCIVVVVVVVGMVSDIWLLLFFYLFLLLPYYVCVTIVVKVEGRRLQPTPQMVVLLQPFGWTFSLLRQCFCTSNDTIMVLKCWKTQWIVPFAWTVQYLLHICKTLLLSFILFLFPLFLNLMQAWTHPSKTDTLIVLVNLLLSLLLWKNYLLLYCTTTMSIWIWLHLLTISWL